MSDTIIDIERAVVSFREDVALRGVSLKVSSGEFVGIVGPNGAGKTTLLTVVNGLGKLLSGQVRVLGHTLKSGNGHALRKKVGYVPQLENIDPHMPINVHEEQQRVAIARCLAQEPEILLLDEPTASLDFRAQREILELVKLIHNLRHLTSLFVTHDLTTLPTICNRLVLMKKGLIWGDGSPEKILTDLNLSRLYDIPVSEVKRKRKEIIPV